MRKKRRTIITIDDDDDETSSVSSPTQFQRGDHVYQWCSVAGMPRVYQHHGIVLHVEVLEEGGVERLTIADFSNFLPESSYSVQKEEGDNQSNKKKRHKSSASGSGEKSTLRSTGGLLRVYTATATDSPWHKVEYNAPRWKTLFVHRSGVSTTMAASDSPEVVLNRVNFLLQHQSCRDPSNDTFQSQVLPKYHLLFANCECVAMWAKTGRFCTLQGASLLAGSTTAASTAASGMALGQAAALEEASFGMGYNFLGRAGSVAAAAESSTVTAMAPWLVGALTVYGAVTIGGPLLLARSRWNATTNRLNEALHRETISAANMH